MATSSVSAAGQSAVDTLYYDSKWKGFEPVFASYYRIYSIPTDSNTVKRCGSGIALSTTTTYDASAAYQAQVIASQRMASYSEALLSERETKNQGYLKKTTIYPGENVSGYINIERKKGILLEVMLEIARAAYSFSWDVSEF